MDSTKSNNQKKFHSPLFQASHLFDRSVQKVNDKLITSNAVSASVS